MNRMKVRGFTLVELLVVIAIIGMLTAIVSISLVSAKQKSRDSKRIGDLKTIQLALSLYYNDNLMYPTNIYGTGATAPAMGLAPNYLPVVPKDPNAVASDNCTSGTGQNGLASCYHYSAYQTAGGGGVCNSSAPPLMYHLGAGLEDTSNQALLQDVDANDDLEPAPYSSAFVPCSSAPTKFNGNAVTGTLKCAGADAAAASPDSCYDLTP